MSGNEEVTKLEPIAVTRSTAAKLLDCSTSTIWKLQKAGKLASIKVGSDDRILLKSIRALGNGS